MPIRPFQIAGLPEPNPSWPRNLLRDRFPWLLLKGGPGSQSSSGGGGITIPTYEPVPADKIINLVLGVDLVVRIIVDPKFAGVLKMSEGETFTAQPSGEAIFQIIETGYIPNDSGDPEGSAYVIIRPLSVGTATLVPTVDSYVTGLGVITLTDTLTINVYRIATRLLLYTTISGDTNEFLLGDNDSIYLPLNHTINIRMEGRDVRNEIVPLSSQVFDDSLSIGKYHVVNTGPGTATLVPDVIMGGIEPQLIFSADANPLSSVTTIISGQKSVFVNTEIADVLTERYAYEPDPLT